MTKLLRLTGIIALCLTLGAGFACGGSETTDSGATAPVAEGSVHGEWHSGANKLHLQENGAFRWTRPRQCKTPPCPTSMVTGQWSKAEGKIVLSATKGDSDTLSYTLDGDTLMVKSQNTGESWTLKR